DGPGGGPYPRLAPDVRAGCRPRPRRPASDRAGNPAGYDGDTAPIHGGPGAPAHAYRHPAGTAPQLGTGERSRVLVRALPRPQPLPGGSRAPDVDVQGPRNRAAS